MLGFRHALYHFLQNIAGISDDGNVTGHILGNFRGIDIEMDDFRLSAEFFPVSRNTIGKSGADCDNQIGIQGCVIGDRCPMHPQHTHI